MKTLKTRIWGAALTAVLAGALGAGTMAAPANAAKPRYPVEAPKKGEPKGKRGAHAGAESTRVKAKPKPTPAKTRDKKGGRGDTKHAPERHAEARGHHAEARNAAHDGSHKVARGETLSSLARKYGVSPKELAEANGIDSRHGLRAGQTISVPGGRGEIPEPTHEARERGGHGRKGEGARNEGAGAYRVAHGDTLYSISKRTGVPEKEIAAANGLNGRHGLRAGMDLKIPGAREEAAEEVPRGRHAREEAREEARAPSSYRVARGDTVGKIARHFGVSERNLRAANGLAPGEPLERGQRLKIPGSAVEVAEARPRAHTTYAPPPNRETYAPPPSHVTGPPPPEPLMPPPAEHAVVDTPASGTAGVVAGQGPATGQTAGQGALIKPTVIPPTLRAANDHTQVQAIHSAKGRGGFPTSDELASLGHGRFVWPVKGDVISHFGVAAAGLKNDGMNISAPMGASVRAAADGEVVYAGDQVPGFGNLVLIKHSDGWVTAYGQLSKIGVRMRQRVAQGEEVGLVGQSGGVDRPQLHFEVRYAPSEHEKARPVDPGMLLP